MSELSSVVADRSEWLALSLVRQGIPVTILEAFEEPPRIRAPQLFTHRR